MASHGSLVSIFAPQSQFYEGPFGRMFRNLDPWQPLGATEAEQIAFLETLANKMVEPPPPPGSPPGNPALDNKAIPAGYTYLGQFVDHDITFDPTSSLERRNDPDRIHNFRTPRFDLDNLYGRGPDAQPYLYSSRERGKFLIGDNAENRAPSPNAEPDLPRNRDASNDGTPVDAFTRRRRALIGDPRNDENIIVAQFHLAMLKFHNSWIDRGRSFADAQRLTRWHYQWVVIHDFLKRLCGKDLVDSLLKGKCPGKPELCFYKYENQPFMPVEFSVAAYRLGHSMVRGAYHLNEKLRGFRGGAPLQIFTAAPADSLAGNRMLPGFWTIAWSRYVDHHSVPGDLQLSRKIDTKVVRQLFSLPGFPTPQLSALPFRNLLRGWRMGLPSGQAVARRMAVKHADFIPGNDPLWLYILQEAEKGGGEKLGPVGARIVAEVFVGLLAGDANSFYAVDPTWEPELPNQGGGFQLRDLLVEAGVPMSEAEADAVMG
jgi:hypothetical protein